MMAKQMIGKEIEFNKTISDIVWGDIPLTELEYEIIKTPSFCRLKSIQQMGLMPIGYPDAVHTRYKHSIGVMHAADQMLRSIQVIRLKKGSGPETWSLLSEAKNISNLRQCFRIAALLHDLGHPPLSHVLEELFRKYDDLKNCGILEQDFQTFFDKVFLLKKLYDHEPATQYLIEEKAFLVDIKKLITDRLGDLAIEKILNILKRSSNGIYRKLHTIIDSDLDADKIDYIQRDSLFCNCENGFSPKDLFDNIFLHENGGIFYVRPQGITAVNSFLHARYRIIRDIQNCESRRIAVQMCIDAMNSWLGDNLHGSRRAAKIKQMHTDASYTDGKLLDEMGHSGRTDMVQALITGNLNYRQLSGFSWWNFDPITRICLHSLTFYPPAIIELQAELRNKVSRQILLDIRQSRPPEFNVYMLDRSTAFPPAYSWSEITHGILCDSIRDLMVYIYSPIDPKNKPKITIETVQDLARKYGISASAKKYESAGVVMGTDMAILVIRAVYDWLAKNRSSLRFPEIWIYSQYHFLNFLNGITESSSLKTEYHIEPSIPTKIDSVFFRDFEILRLAGLIKMREETVNIPGIESDTAQYKARFDFCLAPYGKEYANLLIANSKSLQQVWGKIQRGVSNVQDKMKSSLIEFAKTEATARAIRAEVISPRIVAFKEKRHNLRRKLFSAGACLLIP